MYAKFISSITCTAYMKESDNSIEAITLKYEIILYLLSLYLHTVQLLFIRIRRYIAMYMTVHIVRLVC